MALERPNVAVSDMEYEHPEVPESIPRGRGKRPKIRVLVPGPDGGQIESDKTLDYTRASTLGKAIEDQYNLVRWKLRDVALGMSRREDLVAAAAAIPANEGDHRRPLQEIEEKARDAVAEDRGANIGTALHKLSERRDAGDDLSYLPAGLLAAMDAYSRCMVPLRVLATETFVVCDELQAAGTFDRVVITLVELRFKQEQIDGSHIIVVIPAGTVLVVDLKTGKASSADYWGPTYGAQQAVYGYGVPYAHTTGRGTWATLLGLDVPAPSTRWALILHVPSDSPEDAGLLAVDLHIGRELAALANQVRWGRMQPGLLSPIYVESSLETSPEPAGCRVCGGGALPDEDVCAEHQTSDEFDPADAEPIRCQLCNYDRHDCPGCGASTPHIENEVRSPCPACELRSRIAAAPDAGALDALWQEHRGIWADEHTQEVKLRAAELERAAMAKDAAEEKPAAVPPARMAIDAEFTPTRATRKAALMAGLREAVDDEALTALWRAHTDIWDDDCLRMVKVRTKELAKATPAVTG